MRRNLLEGTCCDCIEVAKEAALRRGRARRLMSDTVLMHWFYARVSARGPSVGG